MRIVALETVESTGSVAALQDDRVVAERHLNTRQGSAQSLAPAMRSLLADVGWRATDVELLAVAVGPGSFTGLRIGVTTAKAFAYAVGCQVMGANTLEVIAARVPERFATLSVVLDAQRQQLFAADFLRTTDGQIHPRTEMRIVDNATWLASLSPGNVVTGPGLRKLIDRLPAGVIAVDEQFWPATAVAVGQLGFRQFMAGRRDHVFDLAPLYFRRTAAEERWDKHGRTTS
jgi:tRNA threonylcarbamoyladenosine biosynthesis protein TsaB